MKLSTFHAEFMQILTFLISSLSGFLCYIASFMPNMCRSQAQYLKENAQNRQILCIIIISGLKLRLELEDRPRSSSSESSLQLETSAKYMQRKYAAYVWSIFFIYLDYT